MTYTGRASVPLPPIEERLATELHHPLDSPYFQVVLDAAQRGEFARFVGTSGQFETDIRANGDRARMEKHFSAHGLGTLYGVIDSISNFQGPEMPVAQFNSFDEASVAKFAGFVVSGRTFALSGTESEFADTTPSSRDEPHRQLWTPIRDIHGQLPAYVRVTAPKQNIRNRRGGSYIEQDWVLLPQLRVTPPTYESRRRTSA